MDSLARTSPLRSSATLALLAFAMLIVSLDQYIVIVALPEIGGSWGTRRRRCSR